MDKMFGATRTACPDAVNEDVGKAWRSASTARPSPGASGAWSSEGYRVANFEEEIYELDERGKARRQMSATGWSDLLVDNVASEAMKAVLGLAKYVKGKVDRGSVAGSRESVGDRRGLLAFDQNGAISMSSRYARACVSVVRALELARW